MPAPLPNASKVCAHVNLNGNKNKKKPQSDTVLHANVGKCKTQKVFFFVSVVWYGFRRLLRQLLLLLHHLQGEEDRPAPGDEELKLLGVPRVGKGVSTHENSPNIFLLFIENCFLACTKNASSASSTGWPTSQRTPASTGWDGSTRCKTFILPQKHCLYFSFF